MSVLNLQVGAAGDDGTCYGGFNVLDDANGNDIGNGNPFIFGTWALFAGVSGLDGATLNSVYYSVWSLSETGGASPLTTVAFENATTPVVPSSGDDFEAKTRTTKVNWDGAFTTGQFNTSPDLKTSLDDIAGSITAIQALHDDRGSASNKSHHCADYDSNTARAPKLDIDYTAPDPGDLNVLDGETSIADGSATPIDFGSIVVSGSAPQKTFTIENLGDLTITISSVTVPTGYEIDAISEIDADGTTIAGGASKTLIVNLLTADAGTFDGDITINSDDADEAAYNFAVTGTVTAAGGDGSGLMSERFRCPI